MSGTFLVAPLRLLRAALVGSTQNQEQERARGMSGDCWTRVRRKTCRMEAAKPREYAREVVREEVQKQARGSARFPRLS